jgi:tryptophan synthase beta chain
MRRCDPLCRPALAALFRRAADRALGGAKIYFKREDLNHTGSHKINNCLGQILLAKRMGKTRIIAETGAGQHGVATATVCGALRLSLRRLHGRDRRRAAEAQRLPHEAAGRRGAAGDGRARHAQGRHERGAARLGHQRHDTYYIIGTAAGPHPYPEMVRDFQSVIGDEARADLEQEGRLPDALVACIGGGSNAIGLFHPFLDDASVKIYGVEAGGHGSTSRTATPPR